MPPTTPDDRESLTPEEHAILAVIREKGLSPQEAEARLLMNGPPDELLDQIEREADVIRGALLNGLVAPADAAVHRLLLLINLERQRRQQAASAR
jgi:hypothetical protein